MAGERAHAPTGAEPSPGYVTYRSGFGAAAALRVDPAFYDRIAEAKDGRRLVECFDVPILSGRAWQVPRRHLFRVVAAYGPQLVDLNVWNLANPRERFWAARTRQLQRAHLSTYDRLWSVLPYLRPMLTITRDSLAYPPDSDGGRCHDVLGSRCDPYVRKMLTGEDFDFTCHSNLIRAIRPYGLGESDVHDVLNLFQVAGITRATDEYFMKISPARSGDYVEFFAEMDVLCAVSTCPAGDGSRSQWDRARGDPLETCRPVRIEVYRLDPELVAAWQGHQPMYERYRGLHGYREPDAH